MRIANFIKLPGKDDRSLFIPALVMGILILTIVILGYSYYKSIEKKVQTDAQNSVAAISDLKIYQITQWLHERESGAFLIQSFPNVSVVKNYFENKSQADLLRAWIGDLWTAYDFSSASLIDTRGEIRFSSGYRGDMLDTVGKRIVWEVLKNPVMRFSGLYTSEITKKPVIDLLVPLVSWQESGRSLIAILFLRIDPSQVLFPLIKVWPTPSPTGETVLFKVEEGKVVYLNDLRYKEQIPEAAGKEIIWTDKPIVNLALADSEGLVLGLDYRNIPVLASIKKIPETNWFICSKVDLEEINASLRSQGIIVLIIVISLILMASISLGFFWRQQKVRYYQKQYEAEELLRKEIGLSEEKYRRIFEDAVDGIVQSTPSGALISLNHALAKMFGYNSPEDCISAIKDIEHEIYVHPEKRKEFMSIMDSKGEVRGFEAQIYRKDRSKIWISENGHCVRDTTGKILYYESTIANITDRKRAEELFQQERILLRTVIDNLPDAVYAKDLEFRKTLTNRADLRIMNLDKEEDAIGKTDFDCLPGEQALLSREDDISAVNGSPVINREESFVDAQQRKRWLLTSKLPLKTAEGKIIGLVGIGKDITSRKKGELLQASLYDISEAAYTASDMQALYKRIHEVIAELMTAKNLYIALYDEKTEMLSFPYFVDEFDSPIPPKKLGKGLTEYVLRKGEACLITPAIDAELRKAGEIELIGAPSPIWVGVPLKLSGKTIGVIVVQDYEDETAFGEEETHLLTFVSEQITQVIERKKNSETISKYLEELSQLNKSKDKLFSIIAHDLKNPFHSIGNGLDLLVNDSDLLDEDEKVRLMKSLHSNAIQASSLLENLLQWSRSQTGRIDFDPKQIHLEYLVKQCVEVVHLSALQKSINIVNKVGKEISIFADANMIETVLRNLITNSVKFTNENGTVTIDSKIRNSMVEISVEDNGIGISEENQKMLFSLENVHTTFGTRNEKGSGLGLVLCKEFVERNGGHIWIKSQKGSGSVFTFSIPGGV